MTAYPIAESDCPHPEDLLEPLPYAGTPPDPDEWECSACGHWEMRRHPMPSTPVDLRNMTMHDALLALGARSIDVLTPFDGPVTIRVEWPDGSTYEAPYVG